MIPEKLGKWKQRAIISKYVVPSECRSMEEKPPDSAKVGIRKAQKLGIPVEGFRNHVAIDGSLSGVSGKWSAFGWSLVRLVHDEEMGPMQRTVKRAELTASLSLLRNTIGPTLVHVNNRGIIDGLWKGETNYSQRAKDATCGSREELHGVHQKKTCGGSEHVKAHRSEKEKQISLFEKFITEAEKKTEPFSFKLSARVRGGHRRMVCIGVRAHLKGEHWTRSFVASERRCSRWRLVLINPLSLCGMPR